MEFFYREQKSVLRFSRPACAACDSKPSSLGVSGKRSLYIDE
jgi:hypothetical protein